MNIGLLADNTRKRLLLDFCIAYRGILMQHQIYATGSSARVINTGTNLPVYKFLSGAFGGDQQIAHFVESNQIDLLIAFKDSSLTERMDPDIYELFKLCDLYNVPLATNLASAEMLIKSLDRGELDWRENYRQQ